MDFATIAARRAYQQSLSSKGDVKQNRAARAKPRPPGNPGDNKRQRATSSYSSTQDKEGSGQVEEAQRKKQRRYLFPSSAAAMEQATSLAYQGSEYYCDLSEVDLQTETDENEFEKMTRDQENTEWYESLGSREHEARLLMGPPAYLNAAPPDLKVNATNSVGSSSIFQRQSHYETDEEKYQQEQLVQHIALAQKSIRQSKTYTPLATLYSQAQTQNFEEYSKPSSYQNDDVEVLRKRMTACEVNDEPEEEEDRGGGCTSQAGAMSEGMYSSEAC